MIQSRTRGDAPWVSGLSSPSPSCAAACSRAIASTRSRRPRPATAGSTTSKPASRPSRARTAWRSGSARWRPSSRTPGPSSNARSTVCRTERGARRFHALAGPAPVNADLCFLPAAEVAGRIRTRDISPVELTRAVLERIERHDGRVNAFAHLAPDLALDMAKAAEDAVLRGDELGPLHGVPVTIKDLHQLAGHPLALGSLTQAGQVADFDAPVTARLKAAGVILGKTTTPEFGWTGISRSPLTGITHNPWKHGL
ncbi:MAG: hypothetical protein F4X99_23895, partial [Gammaproteobacteria bacterium]|nr:hypothetical protein [Gammaproteobacteria bacterium]